MTDFAITVRDRDVTVDRRPTVVVSGSVNIYTMSVSLDDAWDGYTCRAVFRCGLVVREALIVDGACTVPWEALVPNGSLYIGVYGINGDKRMPTCWTPGRIDVAPGTVTADASQDPSPTVLEQFVAAVGDNRAAAETAAAKAVKAEQETAADQLAVAEDRTAVTEMSMQAAGDAARAVTAAKDAEQSASGADQSETIASQALADLLAILGRDVATLGADGKLLASQVPDLSINQSYLIAAPEDRLTLSCQTGDMAYMETDGQVMALYWMVGSDPTQEASWKQLGLSFVANAGHADTADYAANAGQINGHRMVEMTADQFATAVKDSNTYYLVYSGV